jgi:signal transduction histidine kinase
MQPALLDMHPIFPGRQPAAEPSLAGRASLRLEALGLMTAGIVHDLGNMIQIMSGTVDLLDQHPTIKATKGLEPAIDRAVRSLESARALIRQILSFAHENSNEREDVDLAVCLGGLERLLRWVGGDLRVEIEVAADTPMIFCNRWSLENAVLNLALNARDAMPEGGRLAISAAPCCNRGIVSGVALRISDTGNGMSPETLERAFDPFFTTKSGARGTGLGLTMVRCFAQETGGNVVIDSKLGIGTTVMLQLPVRGRSPR